MKQQKSLKQILFLSACSLVGFTGCGPALEQRLLFAPTRSVCETPETYGLETKTLELKAEDGTGLHAWLLETNEDAPWLIHFHGNHSNITMNLRLPVRLQERLGFNVLMAEYRGYYNSVGRPSEEGFYQDAKAYYDYLIGRGVAPENIIVYGFSLGSGTATQLASTQRVGGLILQAPFSSILDVARERVNPELPASLLQTKFDNRAKIKNVKAPVLIIHGTNDETVPFEQGEALFGLANEPKDFLSYEGDHNTLNRQPETQLTIVFEDLVNQIEHMLQTM